jgi:hypothetical protein
MNSQQTQSTSSSLVFLIGFVLMAAFLTQLNNLVQGPDWVSPRERLQQRMEKTRNICCCAVTPDDGHDDDNDDGGVNQQDGKVERIRKSEASVASHGELADCKTESAPPPPPPQLSHDKMLSMLNALSTHANDRDKSISTLKDEYNMLQEMIALKEDEINNNLQ